VYFNVNFNVFFKLIKVHLFVSELYATYNYQSTFLPFNSLIKSVTIKT